MLVKSYFKLFGALIMKILLINYMETTAPGGINKAVREIAKNLSICGHDVIVIQANPLNLTEHQFYEHFSIIRVSSILDKYILGLNPEMYIYLEKNLKSINPDLVHFHGYHTLLAPEIIYLIKKLIRASPYCSRYIMIH